MPRPLNIGLVHAPYLSPGGEDLAVRDMAAILEACGHSVSTLIVPPAKPHPKEIIYSRRIYDTVRQWLEPGFDVVHAHNTFPRVTIPLRRALHGRAELFVQHLHNYRRSCLSANHFRDGRPCYDCRDSATAWSGIRHGCYRGSKTASAGALIHHAAASRVAWREPDVYVALSEAMREPIERTLPSGSHLRVVPNGLAADPNPGMGGSGAIFVGRLVREKGVLTALDAATAAGVPLTVIGDGPLREAVRARATDWFPSLPHHEVLAAMGAADATLAPSLWQEPFGRVLIESLAVGTPVLSLGRGAAAHIWPQGVFTTARELAAYLRSGAARQVRGAARERYLASFSAAPIGADLTNVYVDYLRRTCARK